MNSFDELYNLVVLEEQAASPAIDPKLQAAYDKISEYVTTESSESIGEMLSKLSEDDLKKSNIDKENLDKLLKLSQKPIPLLKGTTLDDLFSPKNFVTNLYNITINAQQQPALYNEIAELYKAYTSDPTPDNLAKLIITVNLSGEEGGGSKIAKLVAGNILSTIPGTNVVASMLVAPFVPAAPQLMSLLGSFNDLGNGIPTVTRTSVLPSQILSTVTQDSAKYFIANSPAIAAGAAAASKAVSKGAEMAEKAKEKAGEIKTSVEDAIKKGMGGEGQPIYDFLKSQKRTPAVYGPRETYGHIGGEVR